MWEGTLKEHHFYLGAFLAAAVAFGLKVATKVIAEAHHPLVIVLVTQLIGSIVALFVIMSALGPIKIIDEIKEISLRNWLIITGITLGALLSIAVTIRILKSEGIARHGIFDMSIDLLLVIIGGYMFFDEKVTYEKMIGVVILLIGAYLANKH